MKLIIDIDDKVYEDSKRLVEYGFGSLPYVEAIAKGTPYEERPNGKWIEDSGNIACSHCHTIWLYRRTDFCPNCGAKMDAKENEQ